MISKICCPIFALSTCLLVNIPQLESSLKPTLQKEIINKSNYDILKEISEESLKDKKLKEKQAQQEKQKIEINRGYSQYACKKVTCHVTYYTNINNSLQGGSLDRKGISLLKHKEPVIAAPSDIKYGSILVFNEKVNNSNVYKVVDTGGAIRWLDNAHTIMKVDVFVPNVSERWIIKNLNNKVVQATLYISR